MNLKVIPKLVEILKALPNVDDQSANFHSIVFGCLLNLTNDFEPALIDAIESDAILTILNYLNGNCQNQQICTYCLIILNSISEIDFGIEKFGHEILFEKFINVFRKIVQNNHKEAIQSILEIITNLIDSDERKTFLTKNGFPQLIINLVEEECDEEIKKLICDLLVTILSDKLSMEKSYENGLIYKKAVQWIGLDDKKKLVAGILIIGNFGRKG